MNEAAPSQGAPGRRRTPLLTTASRPLVTRGGVLLVHKRAGMASFAVVSQLRRLLQYRKIGFAGTLDPFAEGLLPVFLGRATSLLPFLEDQRKRYRVLMAFGQQSATGDLAGTCLREVPVRALDGDAFRAELAAKVEDLRSMRTQRVPAYSAAKVNGRKLYDYARKGEEVPELYKEIEIFDWRVLGAITASELAEELEVPLPELIQYPAWPRPERWPEWTGRGRRGGDLDEVQLSALPSAVALLECEVSSGTFVRQMVEDLGERMGFPAYAMRLLRLGSGPFQDEEALDLTEVLPALEADGLSFADEDPSEASLLHEGSLDLDPKDAVTWREEFWPQRLRGPGLCHPLCAVPEIPVLNCSSDTAIALLHGQRPQCSQLLLHERYALLSPLGFLGFVRPCEANPGQQLRVERMFVTLEDYQAHLSQEG